jgi:hypothetical protein
MKKLFIFLFIVIVAVIAFWLARKTEPTAETPRTPEILPALTDGKYCYHRSQIATPDAPYAVEENISLTVSGNNVSGAKSGTQAGPDMTNGYEGSLTGTRDGENLDVVFAYTVEGSQNKEQELYKWTPTELQKLRYVLKESGKMLVPDLTSTPTILHYESVKCAA